MIQIIAIITIIAALLLRRYMAFIVRVESISMEPTLRDGQLAIARRTHKKSAFKKGDVVVVDSEELDRTIIKRIAGLPREIIKIDNKTYRIPENHYLLLGDNSDYSSDSRKWRKPYIKSSSIIGKLSSRY